jgi:hypothetical protein
MAIEWIQNKIYIAVCLYNGNCGGTYDDAALILCSLINGIASDLWPGEKIDRKRFNELLVKYCDKECNIELVSIPILLQELESTNQIKNEKIIRNKLKFPKGWHVNNCYQINNEKYRKYFAKPPN